MDNLYFSKIKSLKRIKKPIRVYNFDVPKYESYVANGVCVHNCQNFEISQVGNAESELFSPDKIIALAKEKKCSGIAFTYSEPLVWYEYVMDVAKAAKQAGLRTILKTNGFLNAEPFDAIIQHIDAMNMDIKGTAQAYKKVCDIDLEDDPFSWIMKRNLQSAFGAGIHCEVSHIAIPPFCEDYFKLESVFAAIADATSGDTPIHILKFIPDFKMRDVPPTTDEQLDAVVEIAKGWFRYIYIDYAGRDTNTYCECGEAIIKRSGIKMECNMLYDDNSCFKCGKKHAFILEGY